MSNVISTMYVDNPTADLISGNTVDTTKYTHLIFVGVVGRGQIVPIGSYQVVYDSNFSGITIGSNSSGAITRGSSSAVYAVKLVGY